MDSDDFTLRDFALAKGDDIVERTEPFYRFMQDIKAKGYHTYRRPMDSACLPRVRVVDPETGKAREMIMMASNNYLGLTTHPKVLEAGRLAYEMYGAGSGGVPLLSGTYSLHRELEERLARMKGCEDAILFPTGYSANLGCISALVGRGDVVILDRCGHASMFDGCLISGANCRTFRHNDTEHLQRVLRRCKGDFRGKLIVVDGVFSMDGDIAPLPDLATIALEHGARIMVDDAHATGVIGGRGFGSVDHFGLEGKVDIVIGTLSKALGGLGGFVASTKEVVNYLRFYARSYFFSTSIPPATAASVLAAIGVLEKEPEIRVKLWENVNYVSKNLADLGFDIGDSQSALIPIIVGDELKLRRMSKRVHEEGIYMNAIYHPAVPKHSCRFRLSLMSTHTREDLDRTLDVLARVGREFGVI